MSTSVEFVVRCPRALFTDPISRLGGDKHSYPVPTYQALKGVLESIYWKPTFTWVIDAVRVMNRVITEPVNVAPSTLGVTKDDRTLATYTYLADVEYRVKAHFEWSAHREDLAADRNAIKHMAIARRSIARGGRLDVFLGTRECQADVEPGSFSAQVGAYDDRDEFDLGLMFHSFDYPTVAVGERRSLFWAPKMRNGIITFIRPEDCSMGHPTGRVRAQRPDLTCSVDLEAKLYGADNLDILEAA